jgi:hypothetical protein
MILIRTCLSILISTCIIILSYSCNYVKHHGSVDARFIDTLKTFSKDIPKSSNYSERLDEFEYLQDNGWQLGIDYIENGYNDLQIRVWLGHSIAINRQLVILKLKHDTWSAQIIYFKGKEIVTRVTPAYSVIEEIRVRHTIPKSGWAEFINHLDSLKVFSLLLKQDINEMKGCGGTDGMTYYFEIATPKRYRFIEQCYPDDNLLAFSLYLEKEFGFEYLKD